MPGATAGKKFCSNRCRCAKYAADKRAAKPDPVCAGCGITMPKRVDPGAHQKFCTVKCRDRFYAQKNAAARSARNKRWREANKETLAEKKKAYREANLDKHKAWDRARYLANREKAIAQAKANYEKNKEQIKKRLAVYMDKKRQDPEWVAKEKERGRQKWHKATPAQKEAWRRRTQRRQSRKNLQRVGTVSAADWDAILRIWDHSCAYCGQRLEVNEFGNVIVDVEHVVPLSRGGAHSVGNLVPSCEPCNQRKSTKLLVEWRYTPRAIRRLANGPLAAPPRRLKLP
jgi:5-methylcytosine-specific restriction endonuclease McrA